MKYLIAASLLFVSCGTEETTNYTNNNNRVATPTPEVRYVPYYVPTTPVPTPTSTPIPTQTPDEVCYHKDGREKHCDNRKEKE